MLIHEIGIPLNIADGDEKKVPHLDSGSGMKVEV
jgi:hypothetical protein